MDNPFQEIKSLTDEELTTKINKLTQLVRIPGTIGAQAKSLLVNLYNEQTKRNDQKLEDYLKKRGAKLDKLIDIK